jgi:NodT family efflux transporter outer membrane factor (OMF) lipoprotein
MQILSMNKPLALVRSIGVTHLTALVAVVSAAVLLAACASPGAPHEPLAAAAPQSAGLDPAASTLPVAPRWWTTLGDERLNRLVEQALQGQPSLAAARARVDRARSLADVNRAASGPQATLNADVLRERYSANGLFPPPIAGNVWNSADLQAGLSWSPDFFGQHAAELASALGQARAAQADAAAAATALATQVGRAYVGLARLVAQRDVVERALAQRQEMLALTRDRVAAGLDTRVEQTQAEGAVPDARTQREALEEQISLARHQVAVLTGQAPNALDDLSPQLAALNLDRMPATLGADLLGRRADLVAARWRVEALTQDVAVARTQFYPNINLSAFVGLSALGLDNLFDGASRQFGVSPALHLPLFDGGRLRAQLGARQADLDTAIAQYNGAVLEAVREAADAISSEQSLQRQQREQAAALASAETAHSLALQRYRAGLGNYLIVLNTESQWLAQRRLAVDVLARQLDTRVALMKALGGGWTDTTDNAAALAAAAP